MLDRHGRRTYFGAARGPGEQQRARSRSANQPTRYQTYFHPSRRLELLAPEESFTRKSSPARLKKP